MQPKSKDQQYNEELYNTLEEMYLMLEDDSETEEWYKFATKALMFASPISLKMETEKYLHILDVIDGGISYNNFAILCNNLSARTPDEMKMNLNEYMQCMSLNFKMVKYYNSIVLPIMSKLQRKYDIGTQPRILSLNNGRN